MAICGDDMIRTQLKEMKDRSGLTNKELSELSGVPLSTVSKIMSGHTDIPNYQTVCDLVKAMGGSLDALAGIRPAEEAGPERAEESSEIKLYTDDRGEKPLVETSVCDLLHTDDGDCWYLAFRLSTSNYWFYTTIMNNQGLGVRPWLFIIYLRGTLNIHA